jgi:uncharacterized protein (TIGR02118 family)
VKVIAALTEPPTAGADQVYVPTEEGVTGRVGVAAIAVFRSEGTPIPRGAEAYRVEERVLWDRDPSLITRISFVTRAEGLSHEEFANHWAEVHVPLARVHHPGLARYVQNVVVEKLTPDAPDVDGIAELGFASLEDFRERMYDSAEGRDIIAADVREFIDLAAGWRMLATAFRPEQKA